MYDFLKFCTFATPKETIFGNLSNSALPLFQMAEEELGEELKTKRSTCIICKGKVGPVARSKDKSDLVIYERNGMRLARHIESRCNVSCLARTVGKSKG